MKNLFKKILLPLLFLVGVPLIVYAAGKAYPSQGNQTLVPIAGVNSSNEIEGLLVDAGVLQVDVLSGAGSSTPYDPTVVNLDIAAVGPTDRVQLNNFSATSCTIQSKTSNVGIVYVGGSSVTNASGANEGIALDFGDTYGPIAVTNANKLYVAADTAGDDIKYFCN